MQTRLAKELGLEFPIFAFTHCRDVAAAVSKAGGMGVLGVAGHSAKNLKSELEWIEIYNDSATVWIFGASATSFGADGFVASILHADSARLDQRAGELTVWGSVVLQNQTGSRRLETDHLTYQSQLDRFHTESEFVFRESGRVTEAQCFESDATLAGWRSCQ